MISGLRIQHCHELCCWSQTRLGSGIAVALMQACSCSSNSTSSPGTSTCHRCNPKKTHTHIHACKLVPLRIALYIYHTLLFLVNLFFFFFFPLLVALRNTEFPGQDQTCTPAASETSLILVRQSRDSFLVNL